MGYFSKVQVIERANDTRQYYLICPAQMAEALEIEKGEEIEWVVEDKYRLTIRRSNKARRGHRRKADESKHDRDV